MLKDIGIEFSKPIIAHCDNTSTISTMSMFKKEIKLEYVSTKEHILDIFINPFPKDSFEYMQCMLWVMPLPTS